MNYGNILTTTWKTLWREKVIIWFGLLMMLLPTLIGLIVGGVVTFSSFDALERFFSSDINNLGMVIFFFVYLFVIAASIFMAALSFTGTMKGALMAQGNTTPLTFGELWDASMPYLWRMLGVMFSVGFVLMLIYMLPVILMALIGIITAGIGFLCVFPLMLLVLPLGLVGYLLLSLSMAALIAEDGNVFETIQQAWAVMKANFWPLVLMTVILYFIQMAFGMIVAIPMYIVQFGFMFSMDPGSIDPETLFHYFGIFFALYVPFSAILQSISLTFVNGAWMVSYTETSAPPASPDETDDEIVEYDA